MNPGAHVQPDVARTFDDLGRTGDGPTDPVEGREESVPHRLDLIAAVAKQRRPDKGVVLGRDSGPRPVADRGRTLR